jgi:CMP-N-acetylneuraminic acid synthetase
MINNKKVLAVIPARKDSKRVLNKNIKLLNGIPLIVYSISEAKKSKYIDDIYVSTDGDKIAEIAKKHGANVVIRSKEISKDNSKTQEAIIELLNKLKHNKLFYDIILLLQPTSPMRSVKDIDSTLELFSKNICDSVVSVTPTNPFWSFKISNNFLDPFFDWSYFTKRSQDLPKGYQLNGAIFVFTKELLNEKSFITSKSIPYIMSENSSVDIDTEFDFKLVEFLIKNEKRNKN